MTRAKSNDCYDKADNCPEIAEKTGGGHRHGKESCEKVRSSQYKVCQNHVQSCGLCAGMTPHESNSDCYDTAEECHKVLDNNCHNNKDVCKKVS